MLNLIKFDEVVATLAKIKFSSTIKQKFSQLDENMKDNENLVRGLIELDCTIFKYCSTRLQGKKSLVLKVININGTMLKYATKELPLY